MNNCKNKTICNCIVFVHALYSAFQGGGFCINFIENLRYLERMVSLNFKGFGGFWF